MSSKDVWARLGSGGEDKKASIDTLHGVGGDGVSKTNDPMQTPFSDTSSGFSRTVPDPLRQPGVQFDMGDVLLHRATGSLYGVLDTPDNGIVLERTGERAYVYRRIDGEDPRKWVRCQAEMEDGRFVIHRKAPARR